MADVEFKDFTIEVQGAIDKRINAALEEAAGELESQVKRNSRVDTGKTKNSFRHAISRNFADGSYTAHIGSSDENAIWEEFGTGEYAIPEGGGGRKGYWVFVKGSKKPSNNPGKSYTLKEAKKVMAILRSKGLEAYYTKGKKPSRAFWKAYTKSKDKIIKMLQNSLKGL